MSTTERTDAHCPRNVVPGDYVYLGLFYQGPSSVDTAAYRQDNYRHTDFVATAARRGQRLFVGNYNEKHTCDICGARFFHGAYFLHTSGDIIHTGQDCADKMDLAAGTDMADQRGAIKRSVKAAKVKAEEQAERDAFLAAHPGLGEALTVDHRIVQEIAGKFRTYRKLSDKQVAFVLKLAAEANTPAAPARPAVPVVEGQAVQIEGEVLSTRVKDNPFGPGTVLKMTVADDRGFRVHGTAPACLGGPERGARVRFVADVKRSDDDETFGFFSRPRCAEEA